MANIDIGKLLIEIGLKDSFSKEIKGINKEIRSLEKQMRNLDNTFGDTSNSITALGEKQQYLNKIVNQTQNKFSKQIAERDKLINKYNEERKVLDELAKSQGTSSDEYKKQQQAVLDRANQINKLNSEMDTTISQERKYTKQLEQVNEQYNKLQNGTKDYKETIEDINSATETHVSELEIQQSILEAQGKTWKAYDKVVEQVSTKLQSSVDVYKATKTELSRLSQEEEKYARLKTENLSTLTKEQQKLEEIAISHGEISTEYENQDRLVKELTYRQEEYEATHSNIQKQVEETTSSLSKYKKEIADNYSEMKKYGTTEISQSLIKNSKIFEDIGQKTATASAIGAGVATGVSAIYMEYETGQAKLSTLMDGDVQQLNAVSQEIKRISSETGMDLGGLMEASYNALSSGIPQNELVSFMETASKMAVAGFTDTESATRLLTQTLNTYGESAGTAEEIADLYAKVQDIGVVSIDELSNCMSESLSLGSAFGVQFEDIGASMVKMTLQGTSASEAGVQISRMLEELGDSGSQVGEILKDKTGKSFTELMQSGMHLDDVLTILQDEATAMGVEFNSLWGSSNAGRLLCLNI